jgi:methyl-accepting chemotaxis protein
MALSIRTLLALLSATFISIIAFQGVLVYSTNASLRHTVAQQSEAQQAYQELRDFEGAWGDLRAKAYSWLITRRGPQRQQYDQARELLESRVASVSSISALDGDQLRTIITAFHEGVIRLNEGLRERNTNPAIAQFIRDVLPLESQMVQIITQEGERLLAITQNSANAVLEGFDRAESITSLMIVLTLIAGVLLAITISGVVIRRIQILLSAMHTIVSKRDLTVVAGEPSGEIGAVSRQLNQMTREIASTIHLVQDASQELNLSANRQSGAAQRLKGIASQQGEQSTAMDNWLQQFCSTMKQLENSFGHVRSDAETIGHTTDASSQSVRQALEGFETVLEQATSFSATVEKHKHEINQITLMIGSINQIAQQTNLLALNAAIEAARAGEQGRGFAIVAEEVRALSTKTGQATDQVKSLVSAILNSANLVDNQVSLVFQRFRENAELAKQGIQLTDEIRDGVGKIVVNAIDSAQQIEVMSRAVGVVASVARRINEGAIEVTDASGEVAKLSEHSQQLAKKLSVSATSFSA